MKIALVTSWGEECGVADYSRALADALRPRLDVEVIPLLRSNRTVRDFQRLADRCNEFDRVHVQHEYVYFGGHQPWNYRWAWFSRRLRAPYLVTSHTWLRPSPAGPFWKKTGRAARAFLFRAAGWEQYLAGPQFAGARTVIVHSRAYREALVAAGLGPDQVRFFFQAVPESPPLGNADRAREKWGFREPAVVLFGFLNPAKGQSWFLDSWPPLAEGRRLVIVGKPFSETDREYAEEVRSKAGRLGSKVLLTGYVPPQDLADLLAAAEVVVLPYLSGTSSYSLSWLLAMGLPVLASDLDCFRELRAAGPCLELFRAGDGEDCLRRLRELLEIPERRQRLRQEARVWSREHSWPQLAEAHAKLYEAMA